MKKILILLLTLTCLLSCEDLLDKKNLESMGSDVVWDDPILMESYVNNLYAKYPTWNRHENDMTDESRNGYRTHNAWRFARGEWGLDWNDNAYWAYDYVRKCNEILEHIDNLPAEESLRNRMKGEVIFIRATAYFKMVIRYGGVPLVLKPQTLDSEDLYPARASIDETFDFITKEYKAAAELLSEYKEQEGVNFGRATWGACKAMEARAYLFWASPLYNTTNNSDRWTTAATLCKELIGENLYQLKDKVRDIFMDQASPENIFAIYYKAPERTHGIDGWARPLTLANGDAGHWGPTQDLVDAFPTKAGLSITETGSGYDPLNPYANRDPRLEAFIITNGSQAYGRTQYNYFNLGTIDASFPAAETNMFRPQHENKTFGHIDVGPHNTITGYFLRKMMVEDLSKDEYSYGYGGEAPFVEIRLGEVILNYAEALNESGNINEACAQLRIIRNRAGITNPDVPAKNKVSKEALRDFIRNERFIELCYEQKRYWDLRRWKIAHTHLGGKRFSGMNISLNILGDNATIIATPEYKAAAFTDRLDMLNKSWTYTIFEVDESDYVFDEKMYFMPIPRSEMETNKNLVQNDDW